jgi:cytochrome b6-f complex iron-sulfur subunit
MTDENQTRRTFLTRLWSVLGLLATAEIVAVTAAFLKPRKPGTDADQRETVFTAGPVERFEPGTVTAFVRGKFYLARLEDGGFLALSRTCTHLGCTVPWVSSDNRFICPCHASQFDIKGDVVNPPAPRAMDIYPITIRNNVLSVDVGRPGKRTAFDASQVTYADVS